MVCLITPLDHPTQLREAQQDVIKARVTDFFGFRISGLSGGDPLQDEGQAADQFRLDGEDVGGLDAHSS